MDKKEIKEIVDSMSISGDLIVEGVGYVKDKLEKKVNYKGILKKYIAQIMDVDGYGFSQEECLQFADIVKELISEISDETLQEFN